MFGGSAQTFRLATHTSVLRGGVVVIAEQVKQTVRQELRQLGDDPAATLLRLAPSRGNADDNVS